MKKMVRLLSVMLLLCMLFGMSAVGASAVVNDGTVNNNSIVIGGSGDVSVSNNGNLVIGADMRPEDDSPYTGIRVEEAQSYESQIEQARLATPSDVQAAAVDAAQKYMAKADGDYSGIIDSGLSLVQANQDFLMYVRDNIDTIDEATLGTAVDLFGTEAVYGNQKSSFDTAAAEADLEAINARLAELESEYQAETAAAEAAPEGSIWDNPEYAQLQTQREAITMAMNMAIDETAAFEAFVPVGKRESNWNAVCSIGHSLADAVEGGDTVVFNTGRSFHICNSTSYAITVDLRGATIDARACDAAFTIQRGGYGGTISFTNGTIIGDGFYVADGAVLNLGGLVNTTLDITVYARQNAIYVDQFGTAVIGQGTTLNGWLPAANNTSMPALSAAPVVDVRGGTVRMTGGIINAGSSYGISATSATVELCSSICEVNSKNGAPAIYGEAGSELIMHGGFVYGSTGIAVTDSTTKLTVNGGAVTGYGPASAAFPNTGAAIAVNGAAEEGGNSPLVYVYGGTLRSEYTAGITAVPRSANKNLVTRIAVDDVNVTIQERQGERSDYAKAVYIVTAKNGTAEDNFGFSTVAALNTKLAAVTGTVTVKMLSDDLTLTTPITLSNATATSITFDGNGHTIKTTAANGINVGAGNVTIKNLHLESNHTANTSGISVSGGTAYIGPSVEVSHFANGLNVTAGTVTVNGFDIENHNDVGIRCSGTGETTVIMCKNDADAPVDGGSLTTGFLRISGGWFLHKEDINNTTNPARKVATYVDPDISYVKYVEKDRYYEVLYNDTPTVEIKSGATGFEADGKTPYVMYDKADPTPIVFTITPAVQEITAVSKTGKEYPIFTAEAGKSGDIRIPDSAVLRDCPAGRYDLIFRFKNGYVIQDKLHFYVFPRYAGLFEVPNIAELSPSVVNPGLVEVNNGNVVTYLIDDNKVDKYNVASGKNIVVVMSERPDKITIGNVPDGSAEMLLENYIQLDNTTWGVVPSGPYAGYYFYFISFADLNNLAVGQNYVFLGWDGIDGALKRLSLNVTNPTISISPDKVDWSKIDSYVNFTVKPGVDIVYIDGERVEDSYWTYDKGTNVLSIKGAYLNVLDNKAHSVEVITPNGKVSATINTGVGLRTKSIDYHVYGGARSLSFVASDKINKEAGVWIGSSNPTRLDASAYTWDGDNGFTLNSAFLNRLALGTYYISTYVYTGTEYKYTTTTFKVLSATQASFNPATGDDSNIFLWVAVLALSGVAITALLLPRFKRGRR